ncbi:hypothetical protein J5N97_019727 [Dioscorea zingiberensis]|uniref:Transcription factor CBF/NF-Y/archaeal histone domain-containing protein n=1 Tax=Dioscorea zingiberensis TaxID=325984 RepID=A0A9D5CFK3_9LILI|nr:hypothetical protein J5N97_019727 [Dioscorea zingiberensis]
MAEAAPETPVNEDGCGGCGVREPDQFLPIANIGRIMRSAVPENGKIAKEAKESVQECVSEFISFITSEATDKCQRERRKTVNGDDLLWAMGTLGFDDYIEPLKLYLQLYRQFDGKGRRDDLFNGDPGISYNGYNCFISTPPMAVDVKLSGRITGAISIVYCLCLCRPP